MKSLAAEAKDGSVRHFEASTIPGVDPPVQQKSA